MTLRWPPSHGMTMNWQWRPTSSRGIWHTSTITESSPSTVSLPSTGSLPPTRRSAGVSRVATSTRRLVVEEGGGGERGGHWRGWELSLATAMRVFFALKRKGAEIVASECCSDRAYILGVECKPAHCNWWNNCLALYSWCGTVSLRSLFSLPQAYLEFFASPEFVDVMLEVLRNYPLVNYHIVNRKVGMGAIGDDCTLCMYECMTCFCLKPKQVTHGFRHSTIHHWLLISMCFYWLQVGMSNTILIS